LQIVCRRRLQHWRQAQWRSRSLHHLSVNTPSGLAVPFLHRCPPSNRCGLASKNTTNRAHRLFTANASKHGSTSPPNIKADFTCQNSTAIRFFFLYFHIDHHPLPPNNKQRFCIISFSNTTNTAVSIVLSRIF